MFLVGYAKLGCTVVSHQRRYLSVCNWDQNRHHSQRYKVAVQRYNENSSTIPGEKYLTGKHGIVASSSLLFARPGGGCVPSDARVQTHPRGHQPRLRSPLAPLSFVFGVHPPGANFATSLVPWVRLVSPPERYLDTFLPHGEAGKAPLGLNTQIVASLRLSTYCTCEHVVPEPLPLGV